MPHSSIHSLIIHANIEACDFEETIPGHTPLRINRLIDPIFMHNNTIHSYKGLLSIPKQDYTKTVNRKAKQNNRQVIYISSATH